MNNKPIFKNLLFIGISLLPLVYLLFIWNEIPETVPTHFDTEMKPDDYSSRPVFFLVEVFMSLLAIGMYFLMRNLHRIDPKRANKPMSPVFDKLAMGMVIFITALAFITISMSLGKTISAGKLLMPLIGLLFAFIGNLMHNVKPNYFVGIRLPWTLSSDYNWRKTHQLTSKLWFVGGLLVAALSLFLSLEAGVFVMMGITTIIVIIPIMYSFSLYKKVKKDPAIVNEEQENNK